MLFGMSRGPASRERISGREHMTKMCTDDQRGRRRALTQPAGRASPSNALEKESACVGTLRTLADVAQLVEHFTRNEGVPGSNPGVGFGEGAAKWHFLG